MVLVFVVSLCALANYIVQPFTPFPQIIGHNCGEAISIAPQSYDPDQGELCLWQAYTSCKTSTLVFVFRGVDTGVTHAITVQPRSGGCAVTVTSQWYTAKYGGRAITTITCTGIQQKTDGLLLTACGKSGDLYLPPRPAEQVGHVCGDVTSSDGVVAAWQIISQDTVASVENCFWQAYSACAQPATLLYDRHESTSSGGDATFNGSHTLTVQMVNGACALADTWSLGSHTNQPPTRYTCANLTRKAGGGLIAHACGLEDDVVIPPATPQSN